MVKQASVQTCVCGQAVTFPEGRIKTACRTKGCGAIWELGTEGFWSITSLAQILAKPTVKLRIDEYPRYPRSKKRRKAGRRC